MTTPLDYIVEPIDLAEVLKQENRNPETFALIDMCKPDLYQRAHIPGAIFLDYVKIIAAQPPVMGLLPEKEQLQTLLRELGITPDTHVVAYDDEGGGKAARLLWTLAAIGHQKMSLLNGGIHAWSNEQFPLDATPNLPQASSKPYDFEMQTKVIANQEYILEQLNNPDCKLMDARSEAEYSGVKKFANRAGHIPGAINLDWVNLMDQTNNLRLKDTETVTEMLHSLGFSKNQEIIVYCQTHHRSALSFVALTNLGFEKVRGYPGSWSDWGNAASTPIE